ncbi:hypothetical protein EHS39_30105 [Ensifer sp. MPMI2T]|nr:hypothetical protein EHS39_30105 [Ensifer sp. MPMI2T]
MQSWVANGLPITELGVPVDAGDAWVRDFLATNRRAAKSASINDGSVRKVDFANQYGLSLETLRRFELRGCPFMPNGRLLPQKVMAWASAQKKMDPQILPFWVDHPEEYEQRKSFAKRIGASQSAVKRWCDMGMPHLSNGWVHIQSALNWASDNRHHNAKYEIPPTALPSANDNGDATTDCAA